jgi:hypothetical protein
VHPVTIERPTSEEGEIREVAKEIAAKGHAVRRVCAHAPTYGHGQVTDAKGGMAAALRAPGPSEALWNGQSEWSRTGNTRRASDCFEIHYPVYVNHCVCRKAVRGMLRAWIEDDNEHAPHAAFAMRGPRPYKRALNLAGCVSSDLGAKEAESPRRQ